MVGKALLFGPSQRGVVDGVEASERAQFALAFHQQHELSEEPRIHARVRLEALHRPPIANRLAQMKHALGARCLQTTANLFFVERNAGDFFGVTTKAKATGLQAA